MSDEHDASPSKLDHEEALQMVETLTGLVHRLCDHPAVQSNVFWLAKATAAEDSLQDLSQAIQRTLPGWGPENFYQAETFRRPRR